MKVDSCRGLLARLKERLEHVDADGRAWETRVMLAYNVYMITDQSRFQWEPVNIQMVQERLEAVEKYIDNHAIGVCARESSPSINAGPLERTAKLYGLAFEVFDRNSYIAASEIFRRRLIANNVDLGCFPGAKCIDLGCGKGRNLLAMAQLGAKSVVGVDHSDENIRNAERFLQEFPQYSRIKLIRTSIYDLSVDQLGCFDFVSSQGVLHHLEFPQKGLEIFSRVIRPGGNGFIYVFGDGGDGIFWDFIDLIRTILKPVPVEFTRDFLKAFCLPFGKIYQVLDFGYVPFQHRFNRSAFEDMVKNAGLKIVKSLDRGEVYDQTQRALLYETDRTLFGEYELRYWVSR